MKKILIYLGAIVLLSLSLSGCLPKKEELSTTGKAEDYISEEAETTTEAELSEDDSLEVIEEELDDTELKEFEAELEALEEEINQL